MTVYKLTKRLMVWMPKMQNWLKILKNIEYIETFPLLNNEIPAWQDCNEGDSEGSERSSGGSVRAIITTEILWWKGSLRWFSQRWDNLCLFIEFISNFYLLISIYCSQSQHYQGGEWQERHGGTRALSWHLLAEEQQNNWEVKTALNVTWWLWGCQNISIIIQYWVLTWLFETNLEVGTLAVIYFTALSPPPQGCCQNRKRNIWNIPYSFV